MDVLAAGRGSVSVLVADSNQTQSQLLSGALRRQGFRVASCPASVVDCLREIKLHSVKIVLLRDGSAGNDHGRYEMLRALHANFPEVGLILLLDYYDRDLVVNALRCGASGLFCLTHESFKSLCRCVTSVHKGQIWANTEQFRYVIDALTLSPGLHIINAKGEELLTQREQQVVALVAEGISNREIAHQLAITENTVKKSLLRIYDKLGVANRVELVLYAFSHNETCISSPASPAGTNGNGRPAMKASAEPTAREDPGAQVERSRSTIMPVVAV